MSFWERTQQHDMTSSGQALFYEEVVRRRAAVEAHRPLPPSWMRSLALEPGFVKASPLLLSYAHTLVHDPRGVAVDQIRHVFSTVPWIERTALRTQGDLTQEARRFALLLDGVVRVFLPAIYDAEGNVAEAEVLRKIPPVYSLRAALIATKLVVGFLEAELKNVSHRPPNAHLLFCTVLRAAAETCMNFDLCIKTTRTRKLIPPVVTVEMVRKALIPFSMARRTSTKETLDEYAVALVGLMAHLDQTLLADLPAAAA